MRLLGILMERTKAVLFIVLLDKRVFELTLKKPIFNWRKYVSQDHTIILWSHKLQKLPKSSQVSNSLSVVYKVRKLILSYDVKLLSINCLHVFSSSICWRNQKIKTLDHPSLFSLFFPWLWHNQNRRFVYFFIAIFDIVKYLFF